MPLRSYEGKVGYFDEAEQMFVTSPNCAHIELPPSPHSVHSVSMLADRHFGIYDPLYHPQPFDYSVAHLALIRHPSNLQHTDDVLWFLPTDSFFDRVRMGDASAGLRTINAHFCDILRDHWRRVKKRLLEEHKKQLVPDASSEAGKGTLRSDPFLHDVMPRMKYLAGRLDIPSSYDKAVMVWSMLQQLILEVEARLTWLLEVRAIFRDVTASRAAVRNVVGAATGQKDIAENLYRISFPSSLASHIHCFAGWCSRLALSPHWC